MGLVLEASLSSPSIAEGQADTITVTITNTTSSEITLHFSSGCQIRTFVTNILGRIVAPPQGGWVCTTNLTSRTLVPHEAQSVSFVWSGGRDFSPAILPRTLPPGLYHVFATLDAYEVRLRTEHLAVRLK